MGQPCPLGGRPVKPAAAPRRASSPSEVEHFRLRVLRRGIDPPARAFSRLRSVGRTSRVGGRWPTAGSPGLYVASPAARAAGRSGRSRPRGPAQRTIAKSRFRTIVGSTHRAPSRWGGGTGPMGRGDRLRPPEGSTSIRGESGLLVAWIALVARTDRHRRLSDPLLSLVIIEPVARTDRFRRPTGPSLSSVIIAFPAGHTALVAWKIRICRPRDPDPWPGGIEPVARQDRYRRPSGSLSSSHRIDIAAQGNDIAARQHRSLRRVNRSCRTTGSIPPDDKIDPVMRRCR